MTTPAGRSLTTTVARSVDVPSEDALPSSTTRTTTVNGLTSTQVWTAATQSDPQTVVTRSPEGRELRTKLDELNRPTRIEVPGLAPTELTYDDDGRLVAMRREDPDTGEVRETTNAYHDGEQGGSSGAFEAVTNALGEQVGFEYDDALRTTRQLLPDYSSSDAATTSAGTAAYSINCERSMSAHWK